MAALAAAARATTVPATPPHRSPMVTACSLLSGKRGPGPPSWASAGSSGGRSSSSLQATKKAREEWIDIERREYRSAMYDEDGSEWPYPNGGGPVIPRYRRGGSLGPGLGRWWKNE